METMKITKELKHLIEKNQNQLKAGIRNHQRLLAILESDPDNTDVQKQLQTEQEHIIVIGLEQKVILDKLRKEYKIFRKQAKINGTKNSIDDKRFNLTIALRRAQKQTIIQRSTANNASLPLPPITSSAYQSVKRLRHQPSPPVADDLDSSDAPQQQLPPSNAYGVLGSRHSSTHSSPEPPPLGAPAYAEDVEAQGKRALLPEELGQVEFLQYLHLATHEVFKEMQNKRVERKRRSTANPQFLYTRGWDISKRKRNFYLSNLTASPPTTRQSAQRTKVAKLQQQASLCDNISPHLRGPSAVESRSGSASPSSETANPSGLGVTMGVTLPGITHLPSGLTIEPVREEQTICIDCKQPGNLSICEECAHAFHVTCHNRPLVSTPRHCPVCYTDAKEARLRQQQQMAAQAHSPITINSVQADQQLVEERLQVKKSLLSRNKALTAQLTELQDQHSKLTISLRTQERERDELVSDQDCTQEKIQRILTFITKIKGNAADQEQQKIVSAEEGLEIVLVEDSSNTEGNPKVLEEMCNDVDILNGEQSIEGTVLENVANLPILSKFVDGTPKVNRPKVVVIPID